MTGESACPTSLQLLDTPWWGRRFRLPIGFAQFGSDAVEASALTAPGGRGSIVSINLQRWNGAATIRSGLI
jgi:hypothetical protein